MKGLLRHHRALRIVAVPARGHAISSRHTGNTPGARLSVPVLERARKKFLRVFPGGFSDPTYLDWERDYKVESHRRWQQQLGESHFRALLRAREFSEIARRALKVEQQSRHSMVFTFEKMALRDAVNTPAGAARFAKALFEFLHGRRQPADRFDAWVAELMRLPRKQARLVTWPVTTVFGFLAQPRRHIFVKPLVMRRAAAACGYALEYESRPSSRTYGQWLTLARLVRRGLRDLTPRDMIDIQSFLWVQGSDEYSEGRG